MAQICRDLAGRNQRLVFTNGCFDLLHVGHVRYLQAARELGDRLVVAVNGDASVRALKGPTRPINTEFERAEVLAALGCVDFVIIFHEERVTDLLTEIRPQLYVKGGDYTADSLDRGELAALHQIGSEIRILGLVPGKSTTTTLARVKGVASVPPPIRLGVLGSGKGSNFRAIADAIEHGTLNAEVSVVISDVEDSGILALARERGMRAEFVAPGRFKTKLEPEAEARMVELLGDCDLVVLAGYMRMIKEPLLAAFPRRIINIHPSLLPQFPGLEAWSQALAAGVSITGCTVHYVDGGMDSGEILAQSEVAVLPGDTAEELHARIQVAEHALYPEVIGRLGSAAVTG